MIRIGRVPLMMARKGRKSQGEEREIPGRPAIISVGDLG